MNSTTSKMQLKSIINRGMAGVSSRFPVVVELVPQGGYRLDNMRKFLQDYAQGKDRIPDAFEIVGITLPQSPGGVAAMDPKDVYAILATEGLWADLDVICHVSAKDANLDALKSELIGLREMGIESVLALTGDKPVSSKGVFEVDSIGLIKTMRRMNNESIQRARPGEFDQAHQFYIAAAVSPYKYTEASQMQQYYKMTKKLEAGANCLITQLGWDWRKSRELFQYLKDEGISVPVIGNVYALTTQTPAPRLMYEGRLPGCVVTRELFEQLRDETLEQQLERTAVQVAMYRQMGAAAIDLGGLDDFDKVVATLERAAAIGEFWQSYQEKLDYGVKDGYYLFNEDGSRKPNQRPRANTAKKAFDFFHHMIFEPGKGLNRPARAMACKSKGLSERRGPLYKFFFDFIETPVKKILFDCEGCGDCYLTENFGICSLGRCAKGLPNVPCGDACPDGTCGNDANRVCAGELVYQAAASEGPEGLNKLKQTLNFRRDPALKATASMLNNLLGKDHMKKSCLIQIGESVHASIPKCGAAMKELQAAGPGAYEKSSGALDYIISLIRTQAEEDAAYIAINVDAFGEDNPQIAIDLMREYVKLVRRHGQGVPVCVDSSNDDVLRAGLEQWYADAPADIAIPLLNSVKVYTIDHVLPWRKDYAFKIIGLLVDDKNPEGNTKENLFTMARTIFEAAVKQGFAPDDMFFDSTVFPLAIDMPMMPDTAGYTYTAFETIKMIKNEPQMKGVHCSLGISNCVRDLPGRKIGVCRAYVAKAMEYGLDAGIVNTAHQYGSVEPAPELLELVGAFAAQDGSPDNTEKAVMLMSEFCAANRKS